MNWCHETTKMGVPPGNRRVSVPRHTCNGTSQGLTPEDSREGGHMRGRSKLFMKYPG
ncbi:MAG: hypothetical protein PVH35_04945 [Syntrophobacterales bacterium]|jgi:hypothetical protein